MPSYRTPAQFKFVLKPWVVNFEPRIPGSGSLTTIEQEKIADKIFHQSRPVPLAYSDQDTRADGTTEMKILLQLDAHRLKSGVESIIGVLGQPRSEKRIVYGELRNGDYEVQWDSPLVEGGDFELGYQDVDGDGTLEIITKARAYRSGDAITVFSFSGKELTRQSCPEDQFTRDAIGSACPIVGQRVTLGQPRNGKRDILVIPFEASDWSHPERYTLSNGHYGLVRRKPR